MIITMMVMMRSVNLIICLPHIFHCAYPNWDNLYLLTQESKPESKPSGGSSGPFGGDMMAEMQRKLAARLVCACACSCSSCACSCSSCACACVCVCLRVFLRVRVCAYETVFLKLIACSFESHCSFTVSYYELSRTKLYSENVVL